MYLNFFKNLFRDSADKPWLIVGAPKGTPNSNIKIKSGTVNGCKLDNLQNPKIQCNEIWTNLQNANRNGTDDQLLGVTVETATSANGQEVILCFYLLMN